MSYAPEHHDREGAPYGKSQDAHAHAPPREAEPVPAAPASHDAPAVSGSFGSDGPMRVSSMISPTEEYRRENTGDGSYSGGVPPPAERADFLRPADRAAPASVFGAREEPPSSGRSLDAGSSRWGMPPPPRVGRPDLDWRPRALPLDDRARASMPPLASERSAPGPPPHAEDDSGRRSVPPMDTSGPVHYGADSELPPRASSPHGVPLRSREPVDAGDTYALPPRTLSPPPGAWYSSHEASDARYGMPPPPPPLLHHPHRHHHHHHHHHHHRPHEPLPGEAHEGGSYPGASQLPHTLENAPPHEHEHAPYPHHHHHHHHHHVPMRHHHHHYHHHPPPGAPELGEKEPDVPARPGPTRPWEDPPISDVRTTEPEEPERAAPAPAPGSPPAPEPAGDGMHPLERKLRELASGPRVDSEPVWEYLDRCEQEEDNERKQHKEEHAREEKTWLDEHQEGADAYPLLSSLKPVPGIGIGWDSQPGRTDPRMLLGFGLGLDRGRSVRHLGSFMYDPLRTPLLPAELLARNMGATIEVRISGASLGRGITEAEWRHSEQELESHALRRLEACERDGVPADVGELSSQLFAPGDRGEPGAEHGRWRLGWRGLEHARMNREIRIANVWNDVRLERQTNKRLRRSGPQEAAANAHTDEAPEMPHKPRVDPVPTAPLSAAAAEQAAWNFWSQPSLARGRVWGTDVYTDDSDVLAMCVHAGWIEAPHIPHVPEWLAGGGAGRVARAWTEMSERAHEAPHDADAGAEMQAPAGATCDLSVVLRIAPKLILYKGCLRGGLRSRSWGNTHDGVSLVVESVELRPPGYAAARGRRSSKARIDHMVAVRQRMQAEQEGLHNIKEHVRPGAADAAPRTFWQTRAPSGVASGTAASTS